MNETPDGSASSSDDQPDFRPWWQPPEDMVPAILPVVAPLVRTESVAITVVGAHVYQVGVELLLERRMRRLRETDDEWWQEKMRDFMETPREPALPLEQRLRYSVIAQGDEVFENSLFRGHKSLYEAPEGLSVMRSRPGGSGDPKKCRASEGLWLWPLPAVDQLEVVARWPGADVARESATLDLSGLEELANQSRPLWEPRS